MCLERGCCVPGKQTVCTWNVNDVCMEADEFAQMACSWKADGVSMKNRWCVHRWHVHGWGVPGNHMVCAWKADSVYMDGVCMDGVSLKTI